MIRVIQIVFALLVVFFGLAFHIRNDTPVTLDFYVLTTIPLPLSGVIVMAFCGGAILGVVVMANIILRLKHENHRLAKKHELATKEIVNLRAIPINDVP